MRDKLEKFIQENRSDFDDRSPRTDLWDKISQDMDETTGGEAKVRRLGFVKWMGIAASVVLLIGMGIAIGLNMTPDNPANMASTEEVLLEEDVERYYQGQVNRRLQRLAKYEHASHVEEDLQEMDTYLQDLKSELMNALPEDREKIITAMIKNYKNRIKILERVLERIEPTNKNKSEDNEGTNI